MSNRYTVLFVCLGNICRSPMAEAIFNKLVRDRRVTHKWDIDSAGIIDYHVGKDPDPRARKCMKDHGIHMNHKARQIEACDFENFDYILCMDEENMSDLKRLAPENLRDRIDLLADYDPEGPGIIRDPYYDEGNEGFEEVYEKCMRCLKSFLDRF